MTPAVVVAMTHFENVCYVAFAVILGQLEAFIRRCVISDNPLAVSVEVVLDPTVARTIWPRRGGKSSLHIAADLLLLESMALALLLGNTGTTTHVRARRRPPIPRAEQLLLALAFLREVRTGHLLLPPKSERLFPGHAAGL